jgi:hypothetical protein
MQVIDSDGHLHEPFDLFERHMEKEFQAARPRIVDLRAEPRDSGRWLVEGRLVPRLPVYQRRRRRRLSLSDAAPSPDEGQRQFSRRHRRPSP